MTRFYGTMKLAPALALALAMLLLHANPADAAVIYSLGAPTVTTSTVSIPVSLAVDSLTTEKVVYVGLDAAGSPALTTPASQFTHWSVDITGAALNGWNQLSTFGTSGFESLAEFETTDGLGNGTHLLGHLVLDTAALALTPGQTYTVSIEGPGSIIGTEIPNQVGTFQFLTPTFTSASQQFTMAIPEPASLSLLGAAAILFLHRRRRTSGISCGLSPAPR